MNIIVSLLIVFITRHAFGITIPRNEFFLRQEDEQVKSKRFPNPAALTLRPSEVTTVKTLVNEKATAVNYFESFLKKYSFMELSSKAGKVSAGIAQNISRLITTPVKQDPHVSAKNVNLTPSGIRSVPIFRPVEDSKYSNSSIFFPSHQSFVNTTRIQEDCTENQVLFESNCQILLQRGSCRKGEQLIEDEETGKLRCQNNGCNYPRTVPYNGECVMMKYFTGCPDGMHLILTRSGRGECDCLPLYIFSKTDHKCFEAFSQGPCHQSEHFVMSALKAHEHQNQKLELERLTLTRMSPLRSSEKYQLQTSTTVGPDQELPKLKLTPQCKQNPCGQSRFVCNVYPCPNVPKPENCVALGSTCEDGKGIFMINGDSLKPECIIAQEARKQNVTHHNAEERILGNIPNLTCSPGTKRDIEGQCKTTSKYAFS